MQSKKFFVVLIISFMCLLAACGGTDDANGDGSATEGDGGGEAGSGEAVDYPTRDIELIVGWGAGGGSDSFGRAIALELEDILGVNVNVVNMEGSGGAIAGSYILNQAEPDGYTLWAMANYPATYLTGVNTNPLEAYAPVARIQYDTLGLHVTDASPFDTIEGMIEYAQENPGQLTIGGTGVGTFDEIAATVLEREFDIELNYVSFDSAGEMQADLLGGHINLLLEEFGPVNEYIQAGDMIPILAFADERIEEYPDVPAGGELGSENLTIGGMRGIVVNGDTPPEIVEILESALEEAKDTERYKQYERDSFLHLRDGWLNSEDYTESIQSTIELYDEILNGGQ
ncbi:tripartite tricarboxylate transporter substrate binding protein [Alkalihalobacillus oceani]|uniref:Tripartite tricarboxylate transporter substrate binding protein n=1 Tax=Halalkalibacter oceani TaxID=1653776 RepID=A0A9X2DQG8_9BACI|nr:tripartite tricarboxylate transporter substrate binding protein [Halalkalibacter oceani]MCM3713965.1 tripartite tricarboxylate transporter substrate binding protein [Halalkalibacter oceani]